MQTQTEITNTSWFESIVLKALNKSLNKTLSFDPKSLKKLDSFEGKVIQVELQKTPFVFQIEVKDRQLKVHKYMESLTADTVIKGTPTALFAMNAEEPISGLPNVLISGDASTGQFFQKWLKNVSPDWEEAWCQLLGDGMGVRVSDTLHGLIQFGKRVKDSLVSDTKDYLVEESRDLIAPAEMEDFLDEVDDLKSEVAHLERRIQSLSSSLK